MCSPLQVMGKLAQPVGNDWDFAAAQEWVAYFLHEAVIDRPLTPRTCGHRQMLPQVHGRLKTLARGTLR